MHTEPRAPRHGARAAAALGAALLALAASPPVAAEQAHDPGLTALLARFAAVPGLDADFREERRSTLLATPVVGEGSVHYARPGTLLRRVRSPEAAAALVDGDTLRLRERGRVETIDLAAAPTMRLVVGSFLLLLAGDEAALRRVYDVDFRADGGRDPAAGPWTLTLRPRAGRMRRALREVTLRGTSVVLTEMRVVEASGDETVTTFSNVDPARRRAAGELGRLFATP
jgi:hypothetical protein